MLRIDGIFSRHFPAITITDTPSPTLPHAKYVFTPHHKPPILRCPVVFGTPHAWAILSGAIGGSRALNVAQTLAAALSAPSPIGMPVVNPPVPVLHNFVPGEGENGGVWPALNHPLVIAFAQLNMTLAWEGEYDYMH